MARKKKPPEHANHERWLVSYADFITLLFAFFVVMFASSQTDKAKARQVSEAVSKAFNDAKVTAAVASILGGTVDDKGQGNAMMKGPGGARRGDKAPQPAGDGPIVDLLPSMAYLAKELKPEIDAGKLQIELTTRGLSISLREAAFFPSGEDAIYPGAYPAIEKIGTTMLKLPNPVRLEGHTDSVPIHNSRFRSNWALSTARGLTMLELLTNRCKIPPERLAIAGYADTKPVDTNDTAEGRARNRRVDVVILNMTGIQSEPVTKESPAKPSPAPPAPSHAKKS